MLLFVLVVVIWFCYMYMLVSCEWDLNLIIFKLICLRWDRIYVVWDINVNKKLYYIKIMVIVVKLIIV